MQEATGVIDKIVEAKGFGFIRVSGQPKDTFFHMSELAHDLEWCDALIERRVNFTVIDTSKGPKAVNIRPAI